MKLQKDRRSIEGFFKASEDDPKPDGKPEEPQPEAKIDE